MKKILFLIAIIITLAHNVSAQSDGFFKGDVSSGYRDVEMMPCVPSGAVGTIPDSDAVPLGSGLLIMTALGGAMVLIKKLKE